MFSRNVPARLQPPGTWPTPFTRRGATMSSISHPASARRRNVFPVGTTFDRLEIIGEPFTKGEGRKTRLYYPCRCRCGTKKAVRQDGLKGGTTTSCGCAQRDAVVRSCTTHGEARSRLHNTRANVIQRCHNPKFPGYADYGGRGIFVCQEWRDSYEPFRDWAMASGYRDDLEIDRIDNDGPYSPENCRWTTRRVQTRNTRRNRNYTAFGETKCLTDWANDPRCELSVGALANRLKAWDMEQALTTPKAAANQCRRKFLK